MIKAIDNGAEIKFVVYDASAWIGFSKTLTAKNIAREVKNLTVGEIDETVSFIDRYVSSGEVRGRHETQCDAIQNELVRIRTFVPTPTRKD